MTIGTIFNHPLWVELKPYARMSNGRDNLDLLQLPDELRAQALLIALPCVSCGTLIRVFRARMKSKRSRISGSTEEHRLFYAATCPSYTNSGCSRSKRAKDAKRELRLLLGNQRDPVPAISIQILDASGMELYSMTSEVKEKFEVRLPPNAASIAFVPKKVS